MQGRAFVPFDCEVVELEIFGVEYPDGGMKSSAAKALRKLRPSRSSRSGGETSSASQTPMDAAFCINLMALSSGLPGGFSLTHKALP